MRVDPVSVYRPAAAVQITLQADPLAVRDALRRVLADPMLACLTDQDRSTAEIVLAEVLNNIVEHGYARHAGQILLELRRLPDGVLCRVEDEGIPMPGGQMPAGRRRTLQMDEPLPEGGFGWYLIRVLTQDLCYERDRGVNRLTFRLETE